MTYKEILADKNLTYSERVEAGEIYYKDKIKPELQQLVEYAEKNNLMEAHKWLSQVAGFDKGNENDD